MVYKTLDDHLIVFCQISAFFTVLMFKILKGLYHKDVIHHFIPLGWCCKVLGPGIFLEEDEGLQKCLVWPDLEDW